MQHISGISRQQIQISSLEDKITSENPVRFTEAFVKPAKESKIRKCQCCKTGNLHTILIFDKRGPPAWYLGGSQSSKPCKN